MPHAPPNQQPPTTQSTHPRAHTHTHTGTSTNSNTHASFLISINYEHTCTSVQVYAHTRSHTNAYQHDNCASQPAYYDDYAHLNLRTSTSFAHRQNHAHAQAQSSPHTSTCTQKLCTSTHLLDQLHELQHMRARSMRTYPHEQTHATTCMAVAQTEAKMIERAPRRAEGNPHAHLQPQDILGDFRNTKNVVCLGSQLLTCVPLCNRLRYSATTYLLALECTNTSNLDKNIENPLVQPPSVCSQ